MTYGHTPSVKMKVVFGPQVNVGTDMLQTMNSYIHPLDAPHIPEGWPYLYPYTSFDPGNPYFADRNVISATATTEVRVIHDMFGSPFVPSVKYMEVKSSINSFPLDSLEGKGISRFSMEKEKLLMKRPKEPRFFPLKFKYPKKPELKPVIVQSPRFRFARARETLERYLAYKDRASEKYSFWILTQRSNRLKAYKRKLAVWEKRVKLLDKRKTDHFKLYLARVEKYKVRLSRYNSMIERSKNFYPRRVACVKPRFPDNPYKRLRLTPLDIDHPLTKVVRWSDGSNSRSFYWTEQSWTARPHELKNEDMQAALLFLQDQLLLNLIPLVEAEEPIMIRKIYDKVHNQSIHVGNLLAERVQTYELLYTNLQRLLKLIQLKKGVLKSAALAIKDPKKWANEVLAFKFGVEPLVSDVEGALKVISEGVPEEKASVSVRTNRKKFVEFSTDTLDFTGQMQISFTFKFEVNNPVQRLLSTLGLINITEIAWEVTPWSFVVDWFIPIGAFLQSHTSALGMTLVSGTRKVKFLGEFNIKGIPGSVDSIRSQIGLTTSLKGRFTGDLISREVLHALPDNFGILRVKNPYSLSHLAESVSLAIQKLKK